MVTGYSSPGVGPAVPSPDSPIPAWHAPHAQCPHIAEGDSPANAPEVHSVGCIRAEDEGIIAFTSIPPRASGPPFFPGWPRCQPLILPAWTRLLNGLGPWRVDQGLDLGQGDHRGAVVARPAGHERADEGDDRSDEEEPAAHGLEARAAVHAGTR